MIYLVAKTFIGGILDGMTVVEETSIEYRIGFVCDRPAGGSPYRITAVASYVPVSE